MWTIFKVLCIPILLLFCVLVFSPRGRRDLALPPGTEPSPALEGKVPNTGHQGSPWCYSVTRSCPTLCDLMNCSTPGLPVLHCLPEFAQTHVHWVSDAIQPSHPLLPLSPMALNLSQHQDLFQWIGPLNQISQSIGASTSTSFQWSPYFCY